MHGGGRMATARVVVPVLAPAVLASVALVFAETMSDYGVSSTLAFQSHFPMATYGIYEAISNLPAQFGVAGVLSILLLPRPPSHWRCSPGSPGAVPTPF